jgi:hypothetical protein
MRPGERRYNIFEKLALAVRLVMAFPGMLLRSLFGASLDPLRILFAPRPSRYGIYGYPYHQARREPHRLDEDERRAGWRGLAYLGALATLVLGVLSLGSDWITLQSYDRVVGVIRLVCIPTVLLIFATGPHTMTFDRIREAIRNAQRRMRRRRHRSRR